MTDTYHDNRDVPLGVKLMEEALLAKITFAKIGFEDHGNFGLTINWSEEDGVSGAGNFIFEKGIGTFMRRARVSSADELIGKIIWIKVNDGLCKFERFWGEK